MNGYVRVYATTHSRAVTPDKLTLIAEGPNLITALGKQVLAAVIAGAVGSPTIASIPFDPSTVSRLFATVMKLGNTSNPAAPTLSDTSIADTTPYTVNSITASYPAAGRVRFSGVIPADALPGSTITESGLFTVDGILIARKTFTGQVKVSGIALQIDHDLFF